jgi:hypothetical protein
VDRQTLAGIKHEGRVLHPAAPLVHSAGADQGLGVDGREAEASGQERGQGLAAVSGRGRELAQPSQCRLLRD